MTEEALTRKTVERPGQVPIIVQGFQHKGQTIINYGLKSPHRMAESFGGISTIPAQVLSNIATRGDGATLEWSARHPLGNGDFESIYRGPDLQVAHMMALGRAETEAREKYKGYAQALEQETKLADKERAAQEEMKMLLEGME